MKNDETGLIERMLESGRVHGNKDVLNDFYIDQPSHHRAIINDFYSRNPDIPKPEAVYVFSSWSELVSQPQLTQKDCIFVDGGILNKHLDMGNCILINDGGIIKANISCGRFKKDGGIVEGVVTERLKQRKCPIKWALQTLK